MKKILIGAFLIVAGLNGGVYGDEGWGPSVYRAPIVNQPAPIIQIVPYYYYYVPMVTMVPSVPQYVPMTTYQNVLVERRYHCFFKRYEVLTVPQTVYVPNRY